MSESPKVIANPGSTLGEALGALIESEVNRLIRPIAEDHGCVYVTAGRPNARTGQLTKLLLRDTAGNEFNIDAVVANQRMQPLVLIESKYIRYKKHNRDKGSWICTAHYSLRRSYPTIRKSIAVLAGSWSSSSKAMLNSFDVSIFEVGFGEIVRVLANYGIDFAWEEKERDRAMQAWTDWTKLSDREYSEIAQKLLAAIEPQLHQSLRATLSPDTPRQVQTVEVTIETNFGETRTYRFNALAEAIRFLESFDADLILIDDSGPPLWPPTDV
ncbi:MAG: hypothetical protein HZC41_22425 [Chloroflexi bacterium]|nr:hypothetical protein [Chloroflexota bacterium]